MPGVQVTAEDTLETVIHGVGGTIIGSDDLAGLARCCAVLTRTEGVRAFYVPMMFTRGMLESRNGFPELP